MSRDAIGIYSSWATQSVACPVCGVEAGVRCDLMEHGTHLRRIDAAPPLPELDPFEWLLGLEAGMSAGPWTATYYGRLLDAQRTNPAENRQDGGPVFFDVDDARGIAALRNLACVFIEYVAAHEAYDRVSQTRGTPNLSDAVRRMRRASESFNEALRREMERDSDSA